MKRRMFFGNGSVGAVAVALGLTAGGCGNSDDTTNGDAGAGAGMSQMDATAGTSDSGGEGSPTADGGSQSDAGARTDGGGNSCMLTNHAACSGSQVQYAPAADYAPNSTPTAYFDGVQAVVADFNCDGKSDIAAGNDSLAGSSPSPGFDVYVNKGDGTFAPSVRYADEVNYERSCTSIGAGDINGDGFPDIVCSNNGIDVFLGNGDGTFQTPPKDDNTAMLGGGTDGDEIRVADMNGDGKPDLVGDNLKVVLNTGTAPYFTAPIDISDGQQSLSSRVVVGDVDGDGKLDVVTTQNFSGSPSQVCYVLNQGSGSFATKATCLNVGDATTGALAVSVADFNGDGKNDLVTAQATQSSGYADSYIFLATGGGAFKAPVKHEGRCIGAYDIVTGDFDADGHADYALDCNADGKVAVVYGNGDGTFKEGPSLAISPDDKAYGWITGGDLKGNGLFSFVVSNATSPPFGTTVLDATCSQ